MGLKRKNIAYLLRHREYNRLSNYRVNLLIMKAIVCEEGTGFKQIWQKTSNSNIAYENGRIYFDNYRNCYTLYGTENAPTRLYSLPKCPASQKIQDSLVCDCSMDALPLPHEGWKHHLLALTAHNWLLRQDLDTGRTLQQIFLSTRYKFRHLSWDNEQCTCVLKSTHIRRLPPVVNQNAIVAMAVFTVFPLEFVCMFEVTRSVFGTSATDAMICQGALIVFHSGGMVRIYSMDHVMESGLRYKANLHQYCKEAGGVVGTEPIGVPQNLHLSEVPPVLFSVRCADHNLTLGGIPWHYIISSYNSKENFKVYSLENDEMVENGSLEMPTASIEPDKCMFHMDNSGRILHIGPNEVRVLKLIENGFSEKHKLTLDFSIDASKLNGSISKSQEDDLIRYSSSGRAVKKRFSIEDTIPTLDETIADLQYENELDLLAVTSTHSCGESVKAKVHLINNETGQAVKNIPILGGWKEHYEYQMSLDLYHLIYIVKGRQSQFKCSIYQLDRTSHEHTENSSRKHSRRKSRTTQNS